MSKSAGRECANAEARTLATAIAARNPRPEPSVVPASVDDAGMSGRWGHRWDRQHSAPLPEGLAGLGARGQEPEAPGPTVTELRAELVRRDVLLAQVQEERDAAQHQLREALAELAAMRDHSPDAGEMVNG